jgi:hypothetical protein
MAHVAIFESDGNVEVDQSPKKYSESLSGGYFRIRAGGDKVTIHYDDAGHLASVLLTIAADLHQQVIQAPAKSHAPGKPEVTRDSSENPIR